MAGLVSTRRLAPALLVALLLVSHAAAYCCYWSPDADKCKNCVAKSSPGDWCSKNKDNCGHCGGTWCGGGTSGGGAPRTPAPAPRPATQPPRATRTTRPAPTRPRTAPAPRTPAPIDVKPDRPPNPGPSPLEWTTGTWTTGYWDCCKLSCSWAGKAAVTAPVRSCSARTGRPLDDPNVSSVCAGGDAAACSDQQPWLETPWLSYGFTAAAVSGRHGLQGDSNCGQCYALEFTDEIHPNGNWGGSHPQLVGHTMVVQITNIGYDVSGEHSFDLQIPGAGQGAFTNGCVRQFPGKAVGDFDCDNHYGGCNDKSGCSRLPRVLQKGCRWRYDVYHWLERAGKTNNPYVKFARVKCPRKLTDISGSVPLDDDMYPSYP